MSLQNEYVKKLKERKVVMDKLNAYQMYFDNLSKNIHKLDSRNKNLKQELLVYKQNEQILRRKVGLELELHKTVIDCLHCKFYLNEEYKESFIKRLIELNDNIYHTQTKMVYKIIYSELKQNWELFFTEDMYFEMFGVKGELPDNKGPMPSMIADATPNSQLSSKTMSNNSINMSFNRFVKRDKILTQRLTKKEEITVKQYFLNSNIIELFFDDLQQMGSKYLEEFQQFYSKSSIEIEINFQTHAFLKKLVDLKNQHLTHLDTQLEKRKTAVDKNEEELNTIMEKQRNLFIVALQERFDHYCVANNKRLSAVKKNMFIIDKMFEMSKVIVSRDKIDKHIALIRKVTKDRGNKNQNKKLDEIKKIDAPIKTRSRLWAIVKQIVKNKDKKMNKVDNLVIQWFDDKIGFKIGYFTKEDDFLDLYQNGEFNFEDYFTYILDMFESKFTHNMEVYKNKVLQIIIFVNKINVFAKDPFAGKESRNYVNNAKLNIKKLVIKGKLLRSQKAALKLGKIGNMFVNGKKEKENADDKDEDRGTRKLTSYLKNNRQDNIFIKGNLMSILNSGRANRSFSIDKGRSKVKKVVRKRANKSMQFYEVINENYKVLNKLKDGKLNSPT